MDDGHNQARKAFLPIADNDLDDAAERVAQAKNIPTLTPPMRKREEAGAAVRENGAQASPPDAAPSAGTADGQTKSHGAHKGHRVGFTQIRVRCPEHVSDQLVLEQQRLRREGKRVTLNYLILCALQKAGYGVEEAELVEDGRRLRG